MDPHEAARESIQRTVRAYMLALTMGGSKVRDFHYQYDLTKVLVTTQMLISLN